MVSLPFVNYGGVLASSDAAARALLDAAAVAAADAGALHIELRHSRRRFDDLPVRSHKVAMAMALATSEQEMWEALDRKVRNQVKKAREERADRRDRRRRAP